MKQRPDYTQGEAYNFMGVSDLS